MGLKDINLPLSLTLIRLLISPLVLPILLVCLLPLNIFVINVTLAIIFLLFSVTDFLDGYLARKYKQETQLGRILDPMADKFLFYSALIALLTVQKIFFYWTLLFIGREFFIMGLRIVALEHRFSIPVSQWGKVKTFMQTFFITYAILNPYHGNWSQEWMWNSVELGLLLGSLWFSLWSAYDYYKSFALQWKSEWLQP